MSVDHFQIFATALTVDSEFLQVWGQRDPKSVVLIENTMSRYEHLFQVTPPLDLANIHPDMKCILRNDGKICRVRVVKINNLLITVQYIDYGQIVYVDYRTLRALPMNECMGIPDLAEAFYVCDVAISFNLDASHLDILKTGVVHYHLLAQVISDIKSVGTIVKLSASGRDITQNWLKTNYVRPISLHDQQRILLRRIPPDISRTEPPKAMNTSDLSSIAKALAAEIRMEISQEPTLNSRSGPRAAPPPTAISLPQYYFTEVLASNMLHNVRISNVADGPWSFSIQLNSDISLLKELTEDLGRINKSFLRAPIMVGKPCIGFSKVLDQFCRCVVINVAHDNLRVSLVDYGSVEDLPVKSCFELPQHLLSTKMIAHPFTLAGLHKLIKLGEDAIEEIRTLFTSVVAGETLLLQLSASDENCVQNCDLFTGTTNIKEILNNKLKAIKVSYAAEKCPSVGQREKVYLTHVDSPRRFYVQLAKREPDITDLQNRINSLARDAADLPESDILPGLACLAQFPDDLLWYRGKVVTITEVRELDKETVDVLFVDYGNTIKTSKSTLKALPNKMVSVLPAQAICCSIDGDEQTLSNPELLQLLENSLYVVVCEIIVCSIDKTRLSVRLEVDGLDFTRNLSTGSKPEVKDFSTTSYTPIDRLPADDGWPVPQPSINDDWRSQSNGGGYDSRPRSDGTRNNNPEVDNYNHRERGAGSSSNDDHGNSQRNRFGDRKGSDDQDGGFRKKFDNDHGGGFRKKFDDDHSGGFKKKYDDDHSGGFKKRFDDDRSGGFKKRFDDDQSGGFKKRFDDDQSGGFKKRFDDDQSGGFKKRFDDDQSGGFKKRFDDDQSGGFKKRFDDDQSGGFKKRFDDDQSGGFKKRFDDNQSGGFKKRFDDDQSGGFKKRFDDDQSGGFKKKFDDDRPRRFPIRNEDRAESGSTFDNPILDPGTVQNVMPTFFVTPHEFYVQLQNDGSALEAMIRDMQTDYSDKFPIRNTETPQEFDIVVAKFSDDRVLYRAEVVTSSPLAVRFVDYGNLEDVRNTRDVYPVMKKLLDLPRQAVLCSLMGVRPVGEDWNGSENGPFQKDSFKCTFHSETDGVYIVSLTTVEDEDVASELIESGLAVADVELIEQPVQADESIIAVAYDLLPGQSLLVYTPYIEGVEKFYVHIHPKSVHIMEQLVKNLLSLPENQIVMEATAVLPNVSCISRPPDSEDFYRSLILEVTEAGVWVQFIDYGDSAEVSFSQIFNIPEELTKWPSLATECKLFGDVSSVTDEAQDTFKAAYEGSNVIISVISVENETLSVGVYLNDCTKLNVQEGVNDLPTEIPLLELPLTSSKTRVTALDFDRHSKLLIKLPDSIDFILDDAYADPDSISGEVVEGSSCAALCADGHWRRGCLISGNEIYLVDTGTIEEIKTIRELLPSFRAQAKMVRAVNAPWPFLGEAEVIVLRDGDDFVVDPTIKTGYVSYVTSASQIHMNPLSLSDRVDQIQSAIEGSETTDVSEDKSFVIAKYLEDDSWYRASVLSRDPIRVKFSDFGNEEEVTDIAPLPDNLAHVPPLAITVKLQTELPESLESDLKAAVSDAVDPISLVESDGKVVDLLVDGKSLVSQLLKRLLLSVGSVVYISYLLTPTNFYVQRSEDSKQLEEMVELLAAADAYEPELDPQSNAIVAAKFEDDGSWYRARVENGQVFFVDHGNLAELSEIRKVPTTLGEILPLALKASLTHPTGEDWSDAAIEAFSEYYDRELRVEEITYRDGVNWLRLSDNGSDVATSLISATMTSEAVAEPLVADNDNIADDTSVAVNKSTLTELANTSETVDSLRSAPSSSTWPTREQTDDDKFAGLNETDEQKRGKMDDCKCDDEKEVTITENVNVPDSELEEENVTDSETSPDAAPSMNENDHQTHDEAVTVSESETNEENVTDSETTPDAAPNMNENDNPTHDEAVTVSESEIKEEKVTDSETTPDAAPRINENDNLTHNEAVTVSESEIKEENVTDSETTPDAAPRINENDNLTHNEAVTVSESEIIEENVTDSETTPDAAPSMNENDNQTHDDAVSVSENEMEIEETYFDVPDDELELEQVVTQNEDNVTPETFHSVETGTVQIGEVIKDEKSDGNGNMASGKDTELNNSVDSLDSGTSTQQGSENTNDVEVSTDNIANSSIETSIENVEVTSITDQKPIKKDPVEKIVPGSISRGVVLASDEGSPTSE